MNLTQLARHPLARHVWIYMLGASVLQVVKGARQVVTGALEILEHDRVSTEAYLAEQHGGGPVTGEDPDAPAPTPPPPPADPPADPPA